MKRGKQVVISGPSAGVGKDTIMALFRAKHPDWASPLSLTTRPPRPGEVDGQHMNFVSVKTFVELREKDKFLEWFEVDGNLYGTLREPVEKLLSKGKDVVLRKDVQGALAIKKTMPSSIIICLVPDSWEALEGRIRARAQDSDATIVNRLELAKKELTYQDRFDHVIVNPEGHPEKALADLEKAIGLA